MDCDKFAVSPVSVDLYISKEINQLDADKVFPYALDFWVRVWIAIFIYPFVN